MKKGNYFIGTSGWNYKHWKGRFYPEEMKQKDWLNFYIERFDTVELSASFYHLPKITADFVYIRLHGPDAKYAGSYNQKTLKNWTKDFEMWSKEGKDIYCYFDNADSAYAVHNALKLKEI